MERCIGKIIIGLFMFCSASFADSTKPHPEFNKALSDVKIFWYQTTGKKIESQIVDIKKWDINSQVLGFCNFGDGNFPRYLSFNHFAINKVAKYHQDPYAFIFQVILHEYTHCDGQVGHLEIPGHFMGPSGNPDLTLDQLKKQFRDFVKYMNSYYAIRPQGIAKLKHKKLENKNGKCCICGEC